MSMFLDPDDEGSSSQHHHRFRHLTLKRPDGELECDRMADLVNLMSSDVYERIHQFLLTQEAEKPDDRYSLIDVAKAAGRFCSDANMQFVTNFDGMVAKFSEQRLNMLKEVRALRHGISDMLTVLKNDYGKLSIDEHDLIIATIGPAHEEYEASITKRRQMAAESFFEHIDETARLLEQKLAGEKNRGDGIGAGVIADDSGDKKFLQQVQPHQTSVALAGLYAVLLGGFHEDVVAHLVELTGDRKDGYRLEAALGTVLEAIAEYEKSDHTNLSHVDKAVANEFPAIRDAMNKVIADLEPKMAADQEHDTLTADIYNAANSLKGSFEAYRNGRPGACRDTDSPG